MPWREIEKHPEENSPEVFRAVIEGAPALLWLGDANGKCIFLNRMLREFWGIGTAEVASFDWTGTIHPDDIGMLAQPFAEAMRNRTEMEVEARYLRADGQYRVLRTSAHPRFSPSGDFLGMVGVNTDITEQKEGEVRLLRAMESLSLATEASRLGWGTWDVAAGTSSWDARGQDILGLEPHEQSATEFYRRIHPEDRTMVRAALSSGSEEGRTFDVVYRVRHRDGNVVRVHGTGFLQASPEGVKGTGFVRDVTEQAREEEFQRLVIQELGHRIKNLLGLVNSLVSQTAATGEASTYKAALQGRLNALAASIGIATYGASESSDLRELCEAVLHPFLLDRPDSIRISGAPCRLPERHTRIVGLALHELTTNAVKYGALSSDRGHVVLNWHVSTEGDARQLQVEWTEHGGPEVKAPSGRGFGSRLLEDIIAIQSDARSEIEFAPNGVRYRLQLPL